MVPKREWVRRWVQLREQLSAQVDFDRYFAEGEVGGHAVSVLRAGLCPVPSGELLVGDPFGGLQNRGELPYFVTAPVGDYPLELSVAQTDDGRPVYAAARLRFNYRRAVSFEQALTGKEDLGSFDGGYYGFWADSGWACLCDEKAHRAFCDFAQSWQERNPQGDLYADYFAPLLSQNARRFPQHQPPEGGWLNWPIPGSRQRAVLFRTGWGEGNYPAFWGLDEEGRVCQLVVWMIDLEHQEQQEEAFPWEEDLQRLQDALVWDGEQYQGTVCLQEWEGYFQRQELYPLLVRVGELTDLQVVQGCRAFLERQYQILDVMMTALTDRYPLMQLEYGHLMSENAPEMPNILDKNDFAELLYPQRLILDLEKGCVLAAFDCTWDREKGFGIVVRGEEVLQMDTAGGEVQREVLGLGLAPAQVRPDASILCYPVVNEGRYLSPLGGGEELRLDRRVRPDHPPAFLWATAGDATVPVDNTLDYTRALRKNGVPFELHIFQDGPHAMGLADRESARDEAHYNAHAAAWHGLCVDWLKGV